MDRPGRRRGDASERSEASHRSGVRRRSAERATVLGSPRGTAPRIRLEDVHEIDHRKREALTGPERDRETHIRGEPLAEEADTADDDPLPALRDAVLGDEGHVAAGLTLA